ncbi:MAG: DUF4838 domain-containing protein [Clostridia bacterium]|nr:DUF4838 domain-containing protein [Clostridia bacterium]
MKKNILCLLLSGLLIACAAPLAAAGEPVAVRLSPDAGASEIEAAEILTRYIGQITGSAPAVVYSPAAGQTVSVRLVKDGENAKNGSYTLHADGDGAFYIDAADERGLFGGVWGFLRKICGVEVYAPSVISVPENAGLAIPTEYEYTYVPPLEYAETDWASAYDLTFAPANGLNGGRSGIDAPYGRPVNFMGFGHTLGAGLVPSWTYFDSHPEYYALTEKSGTREPTQVCMSNPDVLKIAIEDVLRALGENYDPDAALNIVNVSQLDNFDYCVCDGCRELMESYGGPSGALIWFVNKVAEAVEPEYPDAVIETLAYEYTRPAPKNITVRDNVCVQLCSIECCFAHAIDDPACPVNAEFFRDLKEWSEICGRLYIWDYTTDFNQTLGVFPNFGVLRDNIRIFREHNAVGIYEQGVGPQINCDTEFADLRAFLLAANMREDLTEEENAALRRGFLEAYYGEGADEIEEYLDYITAHAGNADGHLYIRDSMLRVLHGVTKNDVKDIDALWENAILKCENADNYDAAARVRRSQLSWRYYKACNGLGEFRHDLAVGRWTKANTELFEDLKTSGATNYDESKQMPDSVSPLLYPLGWVEAEGEVLKIDMYLIPAIFALALVITAAAVARKRYPLLAVDIAALCGIFATTWLIDLSEYGLLAESSVTLALILIPTVIAAIYGYSRKKGRPAVKAVIGAVVICAVFGAFFALLSILDKSMLNGLDSHLAYFTVCLVLVGVALLGLLVVLPCAFIRRGGKKNKNAPETIGGEQ